MGVIGQIGSFLVANPGITLLGLVVLAFEYVRHRLAAAEKAAADAKSELANKDADAKAEEASHEASKAEADYERVRDQYLSAHPEHGKGQERSDDGGKDQ